jgi:hypothetical protein
MSKPTTYTEAIRWLGEIGASSWTESLEDYEQLTVGFPDELTRSAMFDGHLSGAARDQGKRTAFLEACQDLYEAGGEDVGRHLVGRRRSF